ncbi:hypothetical protein [Salipaludibacillus neizhouensis]|nr:hypothetical protein [Salipaludibacillus neizhouensis]
MKLSAAAPAITFVAENIANDLATTKTNKKKRNITSFIKNI